MFNINNFKKFFNNLDKYPFADLTKNQKKVLKNNKKAKKLLNKINQSFKRVSEPMLTRIKHSMELESGAIIELDETLDLKPDDCYCVEEFISPNVIEVMDRFEDSETYNKTWFVKLQGIPDDNDPEELKKLICIGHYVGVIPYKKDNEGRIISDVSLNNININKQFKRYKKEF